MTTTNDDVPACLCRSDGVFSLLSTKYAIPIVCAVGALGPARFSTIEAQFTDASTSTLSARLDELADAGILERTQYDEIPPRVEYELTEDGAELARRLEPIVEWAQEQS